MLRRLRRVSIMGKACKACNLADCSVISESQEIKRSILYSMQPTRLLIIIMMMIMMLMIIIDDNVKKKT